MSLFIKMIKCLRLQASTALSPSLLLLKPSVCLNAQRHMEALTHNNVHIPTYRCKCGLPFYLFFNSMWPEMRLMSDDWLDLLNGWGSAKNWESVDWLLNPKCQLESAAPCRMLRGPEPNTEVLSKTHPVCLCVCVFCYSVMLLLLVMTTLFSSHSGHVCVFFFRLWPFSWPTERKWGQKTLEVLQQAAWPHVCACSSQSEVYVRLAPVGNQQKYQTLHLLAILHICW